MAQNELQDLLLTKPKFLEKGPDTQTKLQMSANFIEAGIVSRRPSIPSIENFAEMQEYFCPIDVLEQLLKTNFTQGLTDFEVESRLQEKVSENKESDWKIFLKEINLFAFDLIIAIIISIALAVYGSQFTPSLEFTQEEIITSCLLCFVLLLTIIMGFQQRKKSNLALKKDNGTQINVIRNGKQTQIDVRQLVPGDIFEIQQGTLIQADLRVLESRDLQVQINDDFNNIVQAAKGSQIFQGSLIRSGGGMGVVIKTGGSTTLAQILKRKGGRNLQNQLIWFQQILSLIALLVIVVVLIWDASNWSNNAPYGFRAIEQVIIAMIPSGLLVVVTVSFQMATRRMAKVNLLVQNQESIERLSEINCFCIGLNEVVTSKIYSFNSFFNGIKLEYELKMEHIRQLFKCAISTCNINNLDGTEKSLIQYFKQFDDTEKFIQRQQFYTSKQGVQYRIPFNSSKRYSLSIILENNKYMVYIKGAPEIIWSYCNSTLDGPIDIINNNNFQESLLNQSKKGLRSIGFASLQLDSEELLKINDYGYDFGMQNFTYLGTMYLNVSIDEDAKNILQKIYNKSIKLVIITGEHPETARQICQNSGFFNNPTVIEGTQLYLHVDDQNDHTTRLSNIETKLSSWCSQEQIIFARTCPEQKLNIVKALQQQNYKVAITGEGLTDLGSFKQAEVSVSKKYGSQQMIINASDLVLTSKKSTFLDVYLAIMESRRAINNIIKSIMFCLASNTAMTAALFCYLFLGTPLLLSQNLMLLIKITVDLILGIALAREESEMQIPKRFNVLLYSVLVIGIIEAAGGLMASLTTLKYFGFSFTNLLYTRFEQGANAFDRTYNQNMINLNNTYLNLDCAFGSYLPEDESHIINYQWSAPHNYMNQKLIFVQCGYCSEDQNISNPEYIGNCWNNYYQFDECLSTRLNKNSCYTGESSFFASNSFFIFLVFAQCVNYFALRSQIQPFYKQKVNWLAIYGLIISIALIPIITYVPGIQNIFETVDLPWNLLGSIGFPFCMLLLGMAELYKYLLRKSISQLN